VLLLLHLLLLLLLLLSHPVDEVLRDELLEVYILVSRFLLHCGYCRYQCLHATWR
jgi:hypothetical protein